MVQWGSTLTWHVKSYMFELFFPQGCSFTQSYMASLFQAKQCSNNTDTLLISPPITSLPGENILKAGETFLTCYACEDTN